MCEERCIAFHSHSIRIPFGGLPHRIPFGGLPHRIPFGGLPHRIPFGGLPHDLPARAAGHALLGAGARGRLRQRAALEPVVVVAGEQGGVRGVEGLADIGEAVGDARVADEDAVDRRGLDAAGAGRGRVQGEPGDGRRGDLHARKPRQCSAIAAKNKEMEEVY